MVGLVCLNATCTSLLDGLVICKSSVSLLKWLVSPESNSDVFPCHTMRRRSCLHCALCFGEIQCGGWTGVAIVGLGIGGARGFVVIW